MLGFCDLAKRPQDRTGGSPDLPGRDGTPVWPIRRRGGLRRSILLGFCDLAKRPQDRIGGSPDLPRRDGTPVWPIRRRGGLRGGGDFGGILRSRRTAWGSGGATVGGRRDVWGVELPSPSRRPARRRWMAGEGCPSPCLGRSPDASPSTACPCAIYLFFFWSFGEINVLYIFA